MKRIVLMISILAFLIIGCNSSNEAPAIVEVEETSPSEVEEPLEEEPVKEGIPSPLSGIYAPAEVINQRVVAVMFDNHPRARWQSGLKDAEILYEFPVEAPYTRYLGLYLINSPESIGPIRSSRPYFVTKVLEFDAIYVRVGGSEQAKSDVKKLNIADIDGLTSSSKVFWRNKNKKAPNNLYSSMDAIRQTQLERGYNLTGEYEGFKFHEEDQNIDGYMANSILINYMSNNTTKYDYNSTTKLYEREKDGKIHLDESDDSIITAKNIIIQEVSSKVIDNVGRLEIGLEGTGTGKYITNGVGIDIKWVKDSRQDKTYYYDTSEREIVLNPGTTWIQIVGKTSNIIIE